MTNNKVPFRFEQTVFPVSWNTKYDGLSLSHINWTTIKFKGLVCVGDVTLGPTDLAMELRAESSEARKFCDAVTSRKKYRLILEETEETF